MTTKRIWRLHVAWGRLPEGGFPGTAYSIRNGRAPLIVCSWSRIVIVRWFR